MTEDEMLGIAESNSDGVQTELEEKEAVKTEEPEVGSAEALELCVRYEKARQPWANEVEAREIAVSNLKGEDAEEYVEEVFEWHKGHKCLSSFSANLFPITLWG